MRILSMNASFGKLEHETLSLVPGFNIIEAPNEWGKSTWCAFLVAMLYGIDTRSKTTKAQLADKERYTPWSGAPMEGSMELLWNGRKITIERSTKGRIPMGDFRAFETETGLDVPELTADNCGLMLLGVEKEVFVRAGFLRLSDLPVTDNEQLRSRLNALVTTGDESGSGQLLEQKLKELKNRCRYHHNGLIPQAQLQKEQLQSSIQEQQALNEQEKKLEQRALDLENRIAALNNHKTALRYRNFVENGAQVRQAEEEVNQSREELMQLEAQCMGQPSREEALENIQKLTKLRQGIDAIEMEEQMLPLLPSVPEPPMGFDDCTPQAAVAQAETHREELQKMCPKRNAISPVLIGLGIALLSLAAFLFFRHLSLPSMGAAAGGALSVIIGLLLMRSQKKRVSRYRLRQITLFRQYGSNSPDQWVADAKTYYRKWQEYAQTIDECHQVRMELSGRKETLVRRSANIADTQSITAALEHWKGVLTLWDDCANARRQLGQKEKHLQRMQAIVSSAQPPEQEDHLTFTEEETNRLLSDANQELKQIMAKLGQYRGQAEALGTPEALVLQQQDVEQRLGRLEETYRALEYAQKALTDANEELQRRFAPRIAESTQDLFSQLTAGRYNKLRITRDLSVQIGAREEDVLRSHQWRSDGTVDQLYLALRMAVARELTPNSPIVLDDALVRFDDIRLKSALRLLEKESADRQVIIFTCQKREKKLREQI